MPRYMLDTNICIYALKDRDGPVVRRLAEQASGSVSVSSIVFAELMLGYAGRDPLGDPHLQAFRRENPVSAFDEAAALVFASLPPRRNRFDRLIAAHALSLGASLVTNNEADFADVPGLEIENWTLT